MRVSRHNKWILKGGMEPIHFKGTILQLLETIQLRNSSSTIRTLPLTHFPQYQGTSAYWPQETQYAAPIPTATQVTGQAPAPLQQPEVTRFATEERTAYQLRGQNGSLRVSAPVGSNEAQLFDEVARQNSEQRRVCFVMADDRKETVLTELGTFEGLEDCEPEDERFWEQGTWMVLELKKKSAASICVDKER
jgi:hypothetical protein